MSATHHEHSASPKQDILIKWHKQKEALLYENRPRVIQHLTCVSRYLTLVGWPGSTSFGWVLRAKIWCADVVQPWPRMIWAGRCCVYLMQMVLEDWRTDPGQVSRYIFSHKGSWYHQGYVVETEPSGIYITCRKPPSLPSPAASPALHSRNTLSKHPTIQLRG